MTQGQKDWASLWLSYRFYSLLFRSRPGEPGVPWVQGMREEGKVGLSLADTHALITTHFLLMSSLALYFPSLHPTKWNTHTNNTAHLLSHPLFAHSAERLGGARGVNLALIGGQDWRYAIGDLSRGRSRLIIRPKCFPGRVQLLWGLHFWKITSDARLVK